jgi:hypothetical protein
MREYFMEATCHGCVMMLSETKNTPSQSKAKKLVVQVIFSNAISTSVFTNDEIDKQESASLWWSSCITKLL